MGESFKQQRWFTSVLVGLLAVLALTIGPVSSVLGFAIGSNGETEELSGDYEAEVNEFRMLSREMLIRSPAIKTAVRGQRSFPPVTCAFSRRPAWTALRAGDRPYQRHQRRLL